MLNPKSQSQAYAVKRHIHTSVIFSRKEHNFILHKFSSLPHLRLHVTLRYSKRCLWDVIIEKYSWDLGAIRSYCSPSRWGTKRVFEGGYYTLFFRTLSAAVLACALALMESERARGNTLCQRMQPVFLRHAGLWQPRSAVMKRPQMNLESFLN